MIYYAKESQFQAAFGRYFVQVQAADKSELDASAFKRKC
jgi:hypothetical protein